MIKIDTYYAINSNNTIYARINLQKNVAKQLSEHAEIHQVDIFDRYAFDGRSRQSSSKMICLYIINIYI